MSSSVSLLLAAVVRSQGDHDDEQHCTCRNGSEQVDGQSARAHAVGENQKQRAGDQSSKREECDERRAAEALSRIVLYRIALLERPVPELGGYKEPRCEKWRRAVERRVVESELRPVQATQQEERRGEKGRPAENERGHEGEKGESGDAVADLDERIFVRARKRQRAQCNRARDGSDSCG